MCSDEHRNDDDDEIVSFNSDAGGDDDYGGDYDDDPHNLHLMADHKQGDPEMLLMTLLLTMMMVMTPMAAIRRLIKGSFLAERMQNARFLHHYF